jgi:hypothetical protein
MSVALEEITGIAALLNHVLSNKWDDTIADKDLLAKTLAELIKEKSSKLLLTSESEK